MTDNSIKAGSLICFSTGAYSNYGYKGHFLTLQDLTNEHMQEAKETAELRYKTVDEAQDRWSDEERDGPYPPDVNKQEVLISALIRAGVLLSINVREIHLGSYGELDATI